MVMAWTRVIMVEGVTDGCTLDIAWRWGQQSLADGLGVEGERKSRVKGICKGFAPRNQQHGAALCWVRGVGEEQACIRSGIRFWTRSVCGTWEITKCWWQIGVWLCELRTHGVERGIWESSALGGSLWPGDYSRSEFKCRENTVFLNIQL